MIPPARRAARNLLGRRQGGRPSRPRITWLVGDADPPTGTAALAALTDALDDLDLVVRRPGEVDLRALDSDVLVTQGPALLAAAGRKAPREVARVHFLQSVPPAASAEAARLLAELPHVELIVTPTVRVAAWLADRLGDECPPTRVLPLPVPALRPRRPVADSPVLVATGRLEQESRFSRLVAAFADVSVQLPQWRLRIVGGGPLRGELEATIQRYGAGAQVSVDEDAASLAEVMSAAAAVVIPGGRGHLSAEVQLAMAAGVPLVAVDGPSGIREVVSHEVDGLLVVPGSRADLASALLRIADDEPLRRRLGAAAQERAAAWQAPGQAERWQALLGAVARGGSATLGNGSPTGGAEARPVSGSGRTAPQEARTEALALAVGCAARCSDGWFVLPAPWPEPPVVVVPLPDHDRFLHELAGAAASPYLSLVERSGGGWSDPRGSVAGMAARAVPGRSPRLTLEPWPGEGPDLGVLSSGCAVDVEFWPVSPTGDLVAPGPNRWTRTVPAGTALVAADVAGVPARVLTLSALPNLAECRFPVDVVYTWVDGEDPGWSAVREQRLAGLGGTSRSEAASGDGRYLSRGQLRYSMRSVHLFAPWVRHVHVVTGGQVPDWLDTTHERISVVDHRDILPADALPSFNSQAIETALHHVPGLAEHFVYFNDDVFLGRSVGPEAFFTPAGQPYAFLSDRPVGLTGSPGAAPYLEAAWNNRRLLEQHLGVNLTSTIAHTPQPHRRSVLEGLERLFAEDLARTARTPFRSKTDVSLLSSMAQHHGLATGDTVPRSSEGLRYVDLGWPGLRRRLRDLERREQDFFCTGENDKPALRDDEVDSLLGDFLESYFPVAAPWERE